MQSEEIKCVVVGDKGVGKHQLVCSYLGHTTASKCIPYKFDQHQVHLKIGNDAVHLCIHNVSGEEEFDMLRPYSYNYSNVFVVCFSLVNVPTLHNAIEKWIPEINRFCPGTPFILVGTKKDLKDEVDKENGMNVVTSAQVAGICKRTGAIGYYECCAVTVSEVKSVFDTAILIGLNPSDPNGNRRCVVV